MAGPAREAGPMAGPAREAAPMAEAVPMAEPARVYDGFVRPGHGDAGRPSRAADSS